MALDPRVGGCEISLCQKIGDFMLLLECYLNISCTPLGTCRATLLPYLSPMCCAGFFHESVDLEHHSYLSASAENFCPLPYTKGCRSCLHRVSLSETSGLVVIR